MKVLLKRKGATHFHGVDVAEVFYDEASQSLLMRVTATTGYRISIPPSDADLFIMRIVGADSFADLTRWEADAVRWDKT